MPAHNQYKTIRVLGGKAFSDKSKQDKDRLTHQWFECGWFTPIIIVMCMNGLS